MLEAAAHSEARSNVNHISGGRGLGVSNVRSGSAILGDSASRLGTAGGGGGGARHTWLAVSSTVDQRRNQNLVEFGRPGCVKASG